MARTRMISPNLLVNYDLAEHGPEPILIAAILPMLADREGRLHRDPRRIKGEGMAALHHLSVDAVEKAVEKLVDADMLREYEVDGKTYLQIANWRRDQRPHPRESESDIPAPLNVSSLESTGDTLQREEGLPKANLRPAEGKLFNVNSGYQNTGSMEERCKGRVQGGKTAAACPDGCAERNAPDTEPKPPRKPPGSETPRRTPEKGEGAPEGATGPSERKASARARKPGAPVNCATPEIGVPVSNRENPPRPGLATRSNWWPHSAESIAIVRRSLDQLAHEVGMPAPDDGIVRKVLDAARGATGGEIHGILVAAFKRHKFRQMYSWGFIPFVVGNHFATKAA